MFSIISLKYWNFTLYTVKKQNKEKKNTIRKVLVRLHKLPQRRARFVCTTFICNPLVFRKISKTLENSVAVIYLRAVPFFFFSFRRFSRGHPSGPFSVGFALSGIHIYIDTNSSDAPSGDPMRVDRSFFFFSFRVQKSIFFFFSLSSEINSWTLRFSRERQKPQGLKISVSHL